PAPPRGRVVNIRTSWRGSLAMSTWAHYTQLAEQRLVGGTGGVRDSKRKQVARLSLLRRRAGRTLAGGLAGRPGVHSCGFRRPDRPASRLAGAHRRLGVDRALRPASPHQHAPHRRTVLERDLSSAHRPRRLDRPGFRAPDPDGLWHGGPRPDAGQRDRCEPCNGTAATPARSRIRKLPGRHGAATAGRGARDRPAAASPADLVSSRLAAAPMCSRSRGLDRFGADLRRPSSAHLPVASGAGPAGHRRGPPGAHPSLPDQARPARTARRRRCCSTAGRSASARPGTHGPDAPGTARSDTRSAEPRWRSRSSCPSRP
ncbi:MAG: hypothetical protein K0Q62_1443, partial [Phenylobacterium sp.]|nr:hypothetical protein [Phenylobacterium sp.]